MRFAKLLAAVLLLLFAGSLVAANYIWPLSNSTTPDEMNTSFGPRINVSAWDFHDGMDLPAATGTSIHAVRGGMVYKAGPGGSDGYSSRHVILKVTDPVMGTLYIANLHMNTIDAAITAGASVVQGQIIGTVGSDDATYSHLHLEFRLGSANQIASVHPLSYLPYTDTANFTAPVLDRIDPLTDKAGVRLVFQASSKLEGDLKRVEVDLKNGATILETRVVDFNDKTTVNEGNGEQYQWKNDISVEGYQTSDMIADGRTDLHYGILLRQIPSACNSLVARVIDIGGNTATSAAISIAMPSALIWDLSFEDGLNPPPGWTLLTSSSGTGTSVSNDPSAAHSGSRGLLSLDVSTTESTTQRACVERTFSPVTPFEWTARSWLRPASLNLSPGDNVYPLAFYNGSSVVVAAIIRNNGGVIVPGIIVRYPDNSLHTSLSSTPLATGFWKKWVLHVLRLGTRETTAVLYDDCTELVRKNWDSRSLEPLQLRAGIALSSTGTTATIHTDDFELRNQCTISAPTSAELSSSNSGVPLKVTKNGDGSLNIDFQEDTGSSGYNLYVGTIGTFYSHGSNPNNLCSAPTSNPSIGIRRIVYPAGASSGYFLVTAKNFCGESAAGYASDGTQVDCTQSTCAP